MAISEVEEHTKWTGLEEAIQRSHQEDAPAASPLAVPPPPPTANVRVAAAEED
jgi:hypothetical protein